MAAVISTDEEPAVKRTICTSRSTMSRLRRRGLLALRLGRSRVMRRFTVVSLTPPPPRLRLVTLGRRSK
jgi:hypothetical protein